jgi:DNA-cytosine methyltransferase
MTARATPPFWIIEDSNGHLKRETRLESNDPIPDRIDLRLYRVEEGLPKLADTRSYKPGSLHEIGSARADLAIELAQAAKDTGGVVVCSHRAASARSLVQGFSDARLQFVVEISPQSIVHFRQRGRPHRKPTPASKLQSADWIRVDAGAPESQVVYTVADLGRVDFGGVENLRCFGLSAGGIAGFNRGTWVGVTSLPDEAPLDDLAHLLGWVRWIRPRVRKDGRRSATPTVISRGSSEEPGQLAFNLPARTNLQIARKLDEVAAAERSAELFDSIEVRGQLVSEQRPLNVVELFAGAGGMGLGFLLANGTGPTRFRIIYSGERHPVYANTLRTNHKYCREQGIAAEDAVPEEVVAHDLRERYAVDCVSAIARNSGGVDILVGGPPCQGFSSANRNSWSSSNPNNQLVDTFLDYVQQLTPRVLLMENVQGILWTPRHGSAQGSPSVAHHVVKRLAECGYHFFPKLLDAAWYGVPQHRNRFFLLGIHEDLGYRPEDFGTWGPFPAATHGPGANAPFVTVQDAISDLPAVANGHSAAETPYSRPDGEASAFVEFVQRHAPRDLISDHLVSRQANYVIDRYSRIPQGGNWQDIADMMTNYAAIDRTHSNIYRRLRWDEPSITIGHYRKSMIVHPSQDRGLSLREAARLQSFPDWFRFAGNADCLEGGLTHKQQQLANAVCPLVTKAVAEFVLTL